MTLLILLNPRIKPFAKLLGSSQHLFLNQIFENYALNAFLNKIGAMNIVAKITNTSVE